MGDLPDDFKEVLRRMFDEYIGNQKARSNNPEDYPRSVQIKDVEALQLHAECMRKRKKLDELLSEAQAEFHEGEGLKSRLFIRLQRMYPAVNTEDGGTRFSSWKGSVYYLGWDKQEGSEPRPAHPEGGTEIKTPIPAEETITDDDISKLLGGSSDQDKNRSTGKATDDDTDTQAA